LGISNQTPDALNRADLSIVMTAPMLIRAFETADLPSLHAMNSAAVPAVNELSPGELSELIGQSLACLVAVWNERPAGFLLCLGEGLTYDSANYRWFSRNRDRFAYTDRICVDETMRGRNAGADLYAALFDRLKDTGRSFVCEVNTRPPNSGSLRFHKRLGFAEIGEADHGEKAVVYLERPSTPLSEAP